MRLCISVHCALHYAVLGLDDNKWLSNFVFFHPTFISVLLHLLMLVSEPPPPSMHTPEVSPSPLIAASPSQVDSTATLDENHHPYHLTLIPGLGIAVTAFAVIMLVVLIILIRRKNRELENFENTGKTSSKDFPPPRPVRKLQEGPPPPFSSSCSYAFSIMAFVFTLNSRFSFGVGVGGTETAYRFFFYVSEV